MVGLGGVVAGPMYVCLRTSLAEVLGHHVVHFYLFALTFARLPFRVFNLVSFLVDRPFRFSTYLTPPPSFLRT